MINFLQGLGYMKYAPLKVRPNKTGFTLVKLTELNYNYNIKLQSNDVQL